MCRGEIVLLLFVVQLAPADFTIRANRPTPGLSLFGTISALATRPFESACTDTHSSIDVKKSSASSWQRITSRCASVSLLNTSRPRFVRSLKSRVS